MITFYFPPDLCAGSFRAEALASALRKVAGADLQLEIITSKPNRYSSFQNDTLDFEDHGWLKIRRFAVPNHESGMFDQAISFIHFARRVLAYVGSHQRNMVVATSSRLMTAALGAQVAKRTRSALYLDIRDIFTDTMNDILQSSPLRLTLPVFRWLENRTIQRATGVNLVSAGFLPYFQKLKPGYPFRLYTNGIDDEFIDASFNVRDSYTVPASILYAGNIGEGQGLHNIVPAAATILGDRANIRIIGDGGRKAHLVTELENQNINNVELHSPVARDELKNYYANADILFLHLNDLEAFKKVLPSKLFEYAATGKPILAGVGGYAAEFLRDHVAGVEVFDPCDAHGMVAAFDRLRSGPPHIARTAFAQNFARSSIMQAMAADIIALARNPTR
ncbi:glycosyltransferase family 4 protein [Sphingosinicella humi]|nr:glycosyltransferase family 4 protein [Sphingosinicella humi]